MRFLLLFLILTMPVWAQESVRLVLIGPPGAGKGTQAQTLAKNLQAKHLSTGDMLRDNVKRGTELGKKAEGYMKSGQLVPDELILAMVADELAQSKSFILDGFPRSLVQAQKLGDTLSKQHQPLTAVVLLQVPDEVLVERLSLRRVCPQCHRAYHLKNNKPKEEGKCDQDGTALVQRPDDREETIKKRLQVYHDQTEPIVSFYRQQGLVTEIDGTKPIAEVEKRLLELCERWKKQPASSAK